MPFPTIRSTAKHYASVSTGIPYPADVVAGDLLIWCASSSSELLTETGWTLIANGVSFGSYGVAFKKIADGTEGGTTFSAGVARGRNVVVALNAGKTPYVAAAMWGGSSVDVPNPPSLTPGAGSDDYLWLVWGSMTSTAFTETIGAPTNYTMVTSESGVALASREYTGSTDDPGVFTDSDATTSIALAATIAISGYPVLASPLFFGCNF